MMSLPPSKKTAPEMGTSFAKAKILTAYVDAFGSKLQLARRVSVEQAAAYAGVGRTKMYELIEVNAVVHGKRPGSVRRWVDLDSIDELYRSPERLREAEELIRRLREKKMAAKNERENDSG